MGKRWQLGSFQSQSLRRQFRVKGGTETMVACAVQVLRIDVAAYRVRMEGTQVEGFTASGGPGYGWDIGPGGKY